MKKLLNSSSLLIGLALIFAGVLTNRKAINGVSEKALALVLQDNNHAEKWQVKPGSIYDGDTLRVVRGDEELKIRFCGIDAPEIKQPLGVESRDYLRSEAMPKAYRSSLKEMAQSMFYPSRKTAISAL
ncbi:MAG: hypothetical protein AAF298_03225 [Cyanobacteria bacterium P01_A01_bin.40]